MRGFDTYAKLTILGVHSRFDVCSLWEDHESNAVIPGIYHAATPKGRIPILKVLFTNICYKNCNYCANRRDRDREHRLSFEVEELVRITEQLYQKGLIKGLFLSSGTGESSTETFIKMGEVARLLRKRGFKGYIHLKVLPGVPLDAVSFYARYANRLSCNLEAPSERALRILSREKALAYHLKVLSKFGGTTQFVVDYGEEEDESYLRLMKRLFKVGVKRIYFKAFIPIKETPMENTPPGRKAREHSLYQASMLIQKYGFSPEELLEGKRLPEGDLKLWWAERHPEMFPVEVKRASFEELIRVPGIGPKTARKILRLRRKGELSVEGLKKVLFCFNKSCRFLTFNGRRIVEDADTLRMLPLFSQAGFKRMQCGGGR